MIQKKDKKNVEEISEFQIDETHQKIVEYLKTEKRPTVFIPTEVISKINYLCTKISNLEWSGILFYTVEGSVRDLCNMKITLRDILPMNKGTQVSTEFEYDTRYTDYLMNDPERLGWKHGIIHSHNKMDVFFSSTDMSDLKNNSDSHNYYLSVVVNNNLDIIGKIAFIAKSKILSRTSFTALDEDGTEYPLSDDNNYDYFSNVKKLVDYDCEMVYRKPQNSFSEEFCKNVEKLYEPAVKKVSASQWSSPIKTDTFIGIPKSCSQAKKEAFLKEYLNPFDSQQFAEERVKAFLITCFGFDANLSKPYDLDSCIKDVAEDIRRQIISEDAVITDFFTNFTDNFDMFFPQDEVSGDTIFEIMEDFLGEYLDEYSFINKIFEEFYAHQ